MDAEAAALFRVLARLGLRIRTQRALAGAAWGACLGALAALVVCGAFGALLQSSGSTLGWSWSALASAMLVGAGAAYAWPVRRTALAQRLDRAHELAGRTRSALEFAELPASARSPFMAAAIRDANAQLAARDPRLAAPLRPARALSFALLAALGFVLVGQLAALRRAESTREQARARTDAQAHPALAHDDLAAFRAAADALSARSPSDALTRYQALLDQLARGELARAAALSVVRALERELAAHELDALGPTLQGLGEELARARPQLAGPLLHGEAQQAAAALAALGRELARAAPDERERAELEQAIARARERLTEARTRPRDEATDDPSAHTDGASAREEASLLTKKRALAQLAAAAHTPQQRRELERLRRELAAESERRELERLRREPASDAREREHRSRETPNGARELERLRRELARAEDALAKRDHAEAGRALEQSGAALSRLGDARELARELAQLREQLQRARDNASTRRTGEGSRRDASGRNTRERDDLERRRERFRLRAQGEDEGADAGVTLARTSDAPRTASAPSDAGAGAAPRGAANGERVDAGASLVLVPSAGGAVELAPRTPESQSEDSSPALTTSESAAAPDDRHDARRQPPSTRTRRYDDQTLSGEQSVGPTRSQVIAGAARRGFASASYRKVYGDYRAHADALIERDEIPEGYRFYVQRYFQLIRPRDEQEAP